MIVLLADVNIEGHVRRLVARMQAEPWREFWEYLELSLMTFHDVGLAPTDPDSLVWQRCQERQLFLLTNNRNDDGPDSLEATIRTRNDPICLPVFTIGDADEILRSRDYAEEVVEAFLTNCCELTCCEVQVGFICLELMTFASLTPRLTPVPRFDSMESSWPTLPASNWQATSTTP